MTYIKDLRTSDRFTLAGKADVYRVTQPVTTSGGLTRVTYVHESASPRHEFTFAKAALTSASKV